jgi:hypothetical protein
MNLPRDDHEAARQMTDEANRLVASFAVGIHQFIDRARIGSRRDGWPPSVGNGDGGGAFGETSVESAVIANLEVDQPHDPTKRDCTRALTIFDRAVRDMQRACSLVADQARQGSTVLPAGCWAMARIGHWEPIHRYTVHVNGQAYALGRWAYDFTRNVGRLPTVAECERHSRGQQVRMPA